MLELALANCCLLGSARLRPGQRRLHAPLSLDATCYTVTNNVRERERHTLAMTAAETLYLLWQTGSLQQPPDLDTKMRRLKDLSAYALIHAEILEQREGVEMLALAMFFRAISDPAYHPNRERLQHLSEETVNYQGRGFARRWLGDFRISRFL